MLLGNCFLSKVRSVLVSTAPPCSSRGPGLRLEKGREVEEEGEGVSLSNHQQPRHLCHQPWQWR